MIQVVALHEAQIDKIVEVIQDYCKSVRSGSTVPDQSREDELQEVDAILAALRTPDSSHLHNWPDPDARPTY